MLGRTAAALTRRPVVTTFANSSYSPAQLANPTVSRYKLRAAQVVDAATARLAVRFQAVSESVATDMARRLRVSRQRIVVVPRARRRDVLGEPTPERRLTVRRRLGLADDQPVVLTIARHEHHKALDVLVGAVAALRSDRPELVALVAGRPGRATESLTEAISATGCADVIRLLGARTDVPDLITAADVVVIPSRVEGLPGAVLEAMALERPVIASDIPMMREAIGDDAYALVAVDDVAGIRGRDRPSAWTIPSALRSLLAPGPASRSGSRRMPSSPGSSGSTSRRWKPRGGGEGGPPDGRARRRVGEHRAIATLVTCATSPGLALLARGASRLSLSRVWTFSRLALETSMVPNAARW